MLDATVVNVALPHIGEDFDASVSALQWVLTGYLLALASLILLGGALGDRFGRRKVFVIGTVWFAAASLLCGAAPNIEVLVGGAGAPRRRRRAAHARQPRHPAGELPRERPGQGRGRVVGPRRRRGRDRAVRRRLARRRAGLAVGLPDQRARRRARRSCARTPRCRRRATRTRRAASTWSARASPSSASAPRRGRSPKRARAAGRAPACLAAGVDRGRRHRRLRVADAARPRSARSARAVPQPRVHRDEPGDGAAVRGDRRVVLPRGLRTAGRRGLVGARRPEPRSCRRRC